MKECFDYDDLRKIREILFRAIISADSGDANDIVDLVNVIQVKFGEEPYSDINDFMRRQVLVAKSRQHQGIAGDRGYSPPEYTLLPHFGILC